MKHLKSIAAVICLVLIVGCSINSNSSLRNDSHIVENAQPDRHPLWILVWADQTPSRYSNGVPQPAVIDFEPLLQILEMNGGELGFGAIRERSNKPLIRCHFDEPPVPTGELPKPGNAFARANAMKKYVRKLHEDVMRVNEWRKGNKDRRSDCAALLHQALKRIPDAPRTDINGALIRTELFMNEPASGWTLAPLRYSVMITDGIGNVDGRTAGTLTETKLLVVNSAGLLGSLEGRALLRFESIADAFRFIVNDSAAAGQEEGR